MELYEFIWIGCVVFVAATAQSISGFGFALLAVPLMSVVIDPRDAVVIATFIGAFSSSTQACIDRQHTSWQIARRLNIAAYIGMPFGLLLFVIVDESVLRLLVGSVVLVATILLVRGFSLRSTHVWSDWVLGAVSGILATSTSTNGPPLVFLLQAKKLEAAYFRATISTVFSITSVGAIALFVVAGKVTSEGVAGVIISIPILIIGLKIGYLCRPIVKEQSFRQIVIAMLILASVSAFASAVAS